MYAATATPTVPPVLVPVLSPLAWPLAYPFALVLMAFTSLTLYLIFKRRGWM